MTSARTQAAQDLEVFCTYGDAEPSWRRLWAALPEASPFLSYDWHEAWWRTLGEGTPEICLVRDAARELALAPFLRRPDGAFVLSGGEFTDVLDVLAPRGEGLAAVAAHLAATAYRIELDYLPEGSPTLAALPRALRDAGFAVDVARLVVSPRVTLARSFEEQLARLGRKDRHELRRKLRRLEAAGRPSFAYAHESDVALERFVAWHRRAPGEKGAFLTPERERFFREIVRAGTRAGWLRLGELRLDDRPIAVLLGVEHAGTLAAYNSAVDAEAAALSPGILLHAFAIRDAIARGLRVYDLLRGDEAYKYDLGASDLTLWRMRAVRLS